TRRQRHAPDREELAERIGCGHRTFGVDPTRVVTSVRMDAVHANEVAGSVAHDPCTTRNRDLLAVSDDREVGELRSGEIGSRAVDTGNRLTRAARCGRALWQ